MQRKIIIDTSVYIDIFNHNRYCELINPFLHVTYLAYPVLHELWMGLKNKREIRAMAQWRDRFIQLKRLVVPTAATLSLIGEACLQLRSSGKLDPVHPKHYNDISIAALVHQMGAILLTKNSKDFKVIQQAIAFEFERVD